MKSLLLLTVLVSGSVFAAANSAAPLLVKISGDGFVPPQMRTDRVCSVFANQVVVDSRVGSLAVTQKTAITLTGDIQSLISRAAAGKIVDQPRPTDGPTTFWYANDAAGKRIDLKARGSVHQDNQSDATVTLTNLLDALCDNKTAAVAE